nr:hypothetical protein K-LCC10_0060 [Kaumoebavirus]
MKKYEKCHGKMEQIPGDIRGEIAQHLNLRDFKALRRTCCVFSKLPNRSPLICERIGLMMPIKGKIIKFLDFLEEYEMPAYLFRPAIPPVIISAIEQCRTRKIFNARFEIFAEWIVLMLGTHKLRFDL